MTVMKPQRPDLFRPFRDMEFGFPFAFPFDWPFGRRTTGDAWAPRVDVSEKDGMVIAKADLPGLTKDDVKVSIEEDAMVLQGERKSETETKEDNFYISERLYGSFYRRIPLTSRVDAAKAEAEFKDGVLTVKVPVVAVAAPTKVNVAIT
jgi:HSP20 family protein